MPNAKTHAPAIATVPHGTGFDGSDLPIEQPPPPFENDDDGGAAKQYPFPCPSAWHTYPD